MLNINQAKLTDSSVLSSFAERCFREAFSKQNTAQDIDAYCHEAFSESVIREELADRNKSNLLIEKDGKLAGYAQLVYGDSPDCVTSDKAAEIRRFYVDAFWHGKGVAQTLMNACLDEMTNQQLDTAWLGVWQENTKAIRFYEKFGFQKAGEQYFLLGSDKQLDAVLSVQLN